MAGCFKDNTKSKVKLIDKDAKQICSVDVSHHGNNDAYYAVDRIVKLKQHANVFLLIHMCRYVSVAKLLDDGSVVKFDQSVPHGDGDGYYSTDVIDNEDSALVGFGIGYCKILFETK